MPNIDERVVKMTFDNQQFEKGVSQSLKTIDDLKKALELDKMGESLKGLESATAAVNSSLTSIEQNAQRVANVFSPIGRVIQRELDQIADSAIRATKEIAAWTTGLAGLSAGQAKYEAYTKAVQTITNATGKSVKDVGVILNKLSKYTDETSYDFSSMVDNIGKFTSVGVELERAEAAMEGIANWAAKSGAGKQAANRAMYNISQAMGTGSMMIRDWMSIENANMATKEFKEIAIETAKELGTLAETGEYAAGATAKNIVNFQTFRETLRDGWLTADVLTKTLEKYADTTTDFGLAAFHAAQEALTFTDAIEAVKDAVSSGWMRTMEALFGNLDEARVMWTNVANALIEFAEIFSETRNELLQGWHEMGGYNVMVEAASNIWQTFMNVVLGVKEALEQVFPPATAENLLAITNKLKWASEDLLSAFGVDFYEEFEETYTKVYDYAEALTSVLKKGANGEEVRALQERLIKAGYLADTANANGIYGSETEEAVKKLQKELGVNVTGVWDDVTRKATITSKKFNGLIKDTRTVTKKNTIEVKEEYDAITNHMAALQKDLSRGVKNDTVKKLQEQLIRTGFLADKAGADGIYGPKTEEAVKKLQSKLGVTVTGAWDKVTRDTVITSQLFNETIKQERTVYQEVQGLTGPMERVQGIVRGIASALKIAWSILKSGFEVAKRVIKIFDPLFAVLTRFGAMFGEMGKNLSDRLEDADAFEGVVYRITAALEPFARFVENISYSLEDFLDMYSTFLAAFDLENNIGNFFSFVIGYLKRFTILGPVINFVESVIDAVTWLVATIKNLVVSLATWLMDEFTYLFLEGGLSDIIIRSYENNGIVAALLEIFNSATYIVDMIISLIAGIYEAAFPSNQNVDGEKTGLAKVFDGIKTAILVAANAMAFALSMLAQGITLVVQVLGPFFIPALILATQLIANLSKRFAKGEVTSLPGFFMALGRSFAETDTGAKILGTITNRLSKFVEAIKTFINTNFPGLIDTLGEKWESVKNFFSFDKDKTFGENIKSKLEEIKKWFETTIASIKETIQNAFSAIGVDFERVKSLFTYNKDKTFLDNVKDKLVILKDIVAGTVTFILNKFAEIGAGIAQSFTKDENGNIPIFENLKRKIGEIREFISKVISGTGEVSGESSPFIEAIKANLENLRIIITGILDYIWTKLKEFAQAIAAQFTRDENGNLPIFDTLKSKLSAFEPVVDWFISLKDRLIEGFKELTGIGSEGNTPEVGKGFTSVLDKIKELAGNFKNTDIGKMILPIIGGFVGVQLFKTFASVKSIAKTFDEGGIIAVLAGRKKEEDGAVDKIVKIAGSLVAMSLALGLLSIVNYEKVERGLWDLGKAVGAILGGSWLSGKVGIGATNLGETLKNVGDGLLSIVKAIGTLTVIMLLVNTFDNIKEAFEDAKNLVITIGGILIGLEVGFSILDTVLSHFRGASISITEKSTIIKDICDGLLSIAWSIAIVTAAVHFLGKDEAYQAAIIIGGMTIVLGAIAILMEKLSGNKIVNVRIGGFVSMCAGVLLLSFAYTNVLNALKDIKEDDWGKVWVALGIIGAFLGAIAAISFITNNGSHPIAAIFQIVAMGAALILFVSTLGKVIKEIKDVNPELLKWFAVALVGGLLAMTAAIAAFGALGLKTFIGEAGFLALMAVISAGIAMLAEVTTSALDKFSSVLRIVGYRLKSFSTSSESVNWEAVEKATDWLKNVLPGLMRAVADMYTNSQYASATMQELWYFSIALGLFADNLARVGILGMAGSIYALAMVRATKQIVEEVNGISLPESMKNNDFSLIGAYLLIYATELDYLPTEDKTATALSLAQNAKGISEAINTITLNDSAAKSLVLVGAALELYYAELANIGKVGVDGEALENPFDVSQIQIDSDTIASVMQGLAKAIPEDANETISAYGPDGSNDLAGFAMGLDALSTALQTYGEKTKNINNNGQIDAANKALEGITGIDDHLWTLASEFDSIDSFFEQYNTIIAAFTGNITTLGSSLNSYGTLTKTLNSDQIGLANEVIDKFVELDKYFKNGDNPLITIFNGFSDFFNETLGWNDPNVKQSYGILGPIGDNLKQIQNELEGTTETVDNLDKIAIDPNTKLGRFALSIAGFGQALNEYGTQISGLKDIDTSIKIANDLIDHFVKVSESLPKVSGLVQMLGGSSTTLEQYGTSIHGLGQELVGFQDAITGEGDHAGKSALDMSKLEAGFAAMERIMGWGKQFFDDNYIERYEGYGVYDMKFNEVVAGISESIKTLAELSNQKVGDTDLAQAFMDTGSMVLDMIGDGIEKAESENNNLSNSIKDTIKIGVQNAYNSFLQGVNESNGILLNGIGKNIVLAIAKGIKNEENANNPIKQNIESLIVNGVNLISNNLKEFINTGKFVDEGFRIGILGDSNGVIKALQTLALKLIEAFTKVLEVESPSRKFEWIAHMCALGLKLGFDKYSYLVADSSADLANMSVDAIAAAFDANKAPDIAKGAIEAIQNILKIPQNGILTNDQKNAIREMLNFSGYITEDDYHNGKKMVAAIKQFKEEVLGLENTNGSFYNSNVDTLISVINDQIEDTPYDAIAYEKEMIASLGEQYEATANTIIENNDKVVESNKKVEKYATEKTKKSNNVEEEEKKTKEERRKQLEVETKVWKQNNLDSIIKMQKLLHDRSYITEGTYTIGQMDEVTQAALKIFARDIGYREYAPTKVLIDPESKEAAEEAERKAKEYYILADQAAKRGEYTLASKYGALAKEAVDLRNQLEENAYDYVSKNSNTNSLPYNNDFSENFGSAYEDMMNFIRDNGGVDKLLTENIGSKTATEETKENIKQQLNVDQENRQYLDDISKQLEDLGFLEIEDTHKSDAHRTVKGTRGKSVSDDYYTDYEIREAMKKRNFYIYGEEDPSIETMQAMDETITELYGSVENYLRTNRQNQQRIADYEGKTIGQVRKEINSIIDIGNKNRRYRNIYGDVGLNNTNGKTIGYHFNAKEISAITGQDIPMIWYSDKNGQLFRKPADVFSISNADYDFWNSIMEGAGFIAAKNHYNENGGIDYAEFATNQAAFLKMAKLITGTISDENYSYMWSEDQIKTLNRLMNEFGSWAGIFAHAGVSYNPGFKYEGSWMNGGAVSEDAINSFLSYWNGTEDPRRMDPKDNDPLKTIREALGLIGDDGTTEGGGLFDPIYSSVEELTKSLTSEGGLVDVCKSTATDALTELLGTQDGGNGIIGGMFSSLPDVFEGGLEVGKNIGEGVLEGIKQYTSPVLTELLGLSQDGQEEMEEDNKIASPSQVYFDYGAMLMLGLQRGIVSRRDPLLQAIHVISSSMQYAFKLANGINEGISTDYQSLGETIVNSIIQGLENRKDSLIQKMAEISSIALGNATMTVSSLDEAIKNNDDGNTNTIRPIITGGSGETNPIIGNAILGISTNVANANIIAAAIQNDIKDLKTSVDNEHRALISQFDNLNVHLDSIDRDILNMKLYLDGNTLVGGIVGRMDTALGQRRFRAGGRR